MYIDSFNNRIREELRRQIGNVDSTHDKTELDVLLRNDFIACMRDHRIMFDTYYIFNMYREECGSCINKVRKMIDILEKKGTHTYEYDNAIKFMDELRRAIDHYKDNYFTMLTNIRLLDKVMDRLENKFADTIINPEMNICI